MFERPHVDAIRQPHHAIAAVCDDAALHTPEVSDCAKAPNVGWSHRAVGLDLECDDFLAADEHEIHVGGCGLCRSPIAQVVAEPSALHVETKQRVHEPFEQWTAFLDRNRTKLLFQRSHDSRVEQVELRVLSLSIG